MYWASPVAPQNLVTGGRLPCGGDAYETNDSTVRTALNHGELAEILVEGYKDSPFGIGPCQDGIVAWVLRPVSGPEHVVAQRGESELRASPDACVEEELHLAAGGNQRLDTLVRNELVSVGETGLDVLEVGMGPSLHYTLWPIDEPSTVPESHRGGNQEREPRWPPTSGARRSPRERSSAAGRAGPGAGATGPGGRIRRERAEAYPERRRALVRFRPRRGTFGTP